MSVRLPRNVIAQLKALAEQRKTGATVLARDLIIESLAAQPGTMSGTIPVAEVLQLVTAHGYVIGGRRAVSAAKAARGKHRHGSRPRVLRSSHGEDDKREANDSVCPQHQPSIDLETAIGRRADTSGAPAQMARHSDRLLQRVVRQPQQCPRTVVLFGPDY